MTTGSLKQIRSTFETTLSNTLSPPSLISSLALTYNNSSTPDNAFQYAYALCKSSVSSERIYGIGLMDSLISSSYEHSSECMYSQACAAYLNEDYSGARTYAESVLRVNPRDEKMREVHLSAVERVEEKEKQMNMAIGGGVVAVGVGLAVGILGLVLGGKK
jgi:hypothetical protein